MNALSMSATRRRDQVVILTGPAIGARCSTNHFPGIGKKICRSLAPRRILGALFSARVSILVAAVALAAMWWHAITVEDTIAAQEAIGRDALMAMPWAIVWAARATRMPLPKEGGEV